jgi:hypothetical protein
MSIEIWFYRRELLEGYKGREWQVNIALFFSYLEGEGGEGDENVLKPRGIKERSKKTK